MKRKTVLLVILLSTCLFSMLAFSVTFNQKTVLENERRSWEKQYQMLYMGSGSMEPTLELGELIIVDKYINPAELNAAPKDAEVPGDIIAYYHPRYGKDPDYIIVHRAVEKYQLENGTWYFYTRGDANFGNDPWSPIRQDYIIGKVVDVNPPLTTTHLNLWLWLIAAITIATGVSSLVIFVLMRTRKEK